MKMTRYEKETIINFNAERSTASIYTRDPAVIRKMDSLVNDYPDIFKCIAESDVDKIYESPKTAITYRKPGNITEVQRSAARERMRHFN
jgi:hypothetical protein